jgi:hypothetical protein
MRDVVGRAHIISGEAHVESVGEGMGSTITMSELHMHCG